MTEDLLQETLARAIYYHAQFRTGSNIKAWTFRILRNLFFEDARRSKRHRATVPQLVARAETTSLDAQIDHIQLKELAQLILRLPPAQRRAINLVGRLGLTYQEAAKLEKCAVGTMKSRVSRAREALTSHWD